MALSSGTRLGPYEILAPLGAGGMGEVYRATDTKLGRQVAIKRLPREVAGDPERLARFRREAQLLASLNHPHIAAIHGLEETDAGPLLVLELVEGEDLAERLKRGPIPLDEAVEIALQITDALEEAHGKGIVHRDLKPANVKLRNDGTVKVLDFGLAKAMDPVAAHSPVESLSPTQASPTMSGAGVILGTAAYMAPEQARGRAVDKRTDVWAFGALLYEMLTGRRAFDGEDATELIAAVVKTTPEWTAFPADVPPHVRTLVQRCLEKDPGGCAQPFHGKLSRILSGTPVALPKPPPQGGVAGTQKRSPPLVTDSLRARPGKCGSSRDRRDPAHPAASAPPEAQRAGPSAPSRARLAAARASWSTSQSRTSLRSAQSS